MSALRTFYLNHENDDGEDMDLVIRASNPQEAFKLFLAHWEENGFELELSKDQPMIPGIAQGYDLDDAIRCFEQNLKYHNIPGVLAWGWETSGIPGTMQSVGYWRVK